MSASRTTRLTLLCLALAAVAWPLTLNKPGLPYILKADEPAYLMMATSLAEDFDLELRTEDTERVFGEFPFLPISNLIVMTVDGWETVAYGKPYLYSLFAAPFAGLFGANGVLLFNVSCFLVMIAVSWRYLARTNPEGLAALFAVAYFVGSVGAAYVFWLQPEIFIMAAVAASLSFGLTAGRVTARRLAFSGALLALAVHHKPMMIALGLPIVYGELRSRRWHRVGAWVAGLSLVLALAAAGSWAMTGSVSSYLGVTRQGVTLCEAGVVPISPAGGAASTDVLPTGGAWSWIFRVPAVDPLELAGNIGYFLWGRHTGLLLYTPFALIALLLFLLHERHDRRRWILLASIASIALFFLVFIPRNWQGGGGFVGNRYFVGVYPAFLFLVVRLSPRILVALGSGLAGLFLGPLLMTPFGAAEPEPTLQAHVRRAPFTRFPLELSLREVPGYEEHQIRGLRILGRKDVVRPEGDALWVRGGQPVELILRTPRPIERIVLQVRNVAPDNEIELSLPGARVSLAFAGPVPAGLEARTVELTPSGPSQVIHHRGKRSFAYVLEIESSSGRPRVWSKQFPPASCTEFAFNERRNQTFYLGASVVVLALDRSLDADLYESGWVSVESRQRVVPGQPFGVRARLVNESDEVWGGDGAAVVKLSYHWLDPAGEVVVFDGVRTDLPLPLGPGEVADVLVEVVAPEAPGEYVLELDPVLEHVAWFSAKNPSASYLLPITVVAAAPSDEAAEW